MTNRELAASQFKAYESAMIEHMFRNAPEPKGEEFGYQHGWVVVNGESFNREMATGQEYDWNQGGWAWV